MHIQKITVDKIVFPTKNEIDIDVFEYEIELIKETSPLETGNLNNIIGVNYEKGFIGRN